MRRLLLLLPALSLTAAVPEGGWRLRLPIAAARGARLQRLVLPARAILAVGRADGGDVRVLDANGRAQPIARVPAPAAPARQVALAPVPILGAADALAVTGVTLKVDDGQARVVRIDGAPAGDGTGGQLVGMLLDTRRIDAPARSLTLALAAPAHQPVTVALDSSADLQDWAPEGERVLFRAGPNAPLTMLLRDEDLRGRFLRVTWRTQGRPLTPVTVTGATLALRPAADAGRWAVEATLPPLLDAQHVAFGLPGAIAPVALVVRPAAGDLPTAVTLSGRQDREQPWQAVGEGIATAGVHRPIALAGSYREWRIEAAPAGEGFRAPPLVELRYPPIAIAFVAAGTPPYTLAVGRADMEASWLPATSLEQMTGDAADASPLATAPAARPGPLALPALPTGHATTFWLLWGVLLLGVAALGAMAWSLARSRPATHGVEPENGAADDRGER